jgi:hypothetical protein
MLMLLMHDAAAQLHDSNVSSNAATADGRCRCVAAAAISSAAMQASISRVPQLPASTAALQHAISHAMARHAAAAAHQWAVGWQVTILSALQQ